MTARKAPKKQGTQPAGSAPQRPVIGGRPVGTRGRTFTGRVVSDRMTKTVTVGWERSVYVPKYQRYERRRTSVKAHDETGARIGDLVEIVETRPISKTKHFIVNRRITQ
nr:30S ribosomal protein S17P [uncultured archaeon]